MLTNVYQRTKDLANVCWEKPKNSQLVCFCPAFTYSVSVTNLRQTCFVRMEHCFDSFPPLTPTKNIT